MSGGMNINRGPVPPANTCDQFAPPAPSTFSELVGISIGEASMCWSQEPQGVFDASRCKALAEKIIDAYRQGMVEARKEGFRDGVKFANA